MYKVGDVVVYGAAGLCTVEDITEKNFGKEIVSYYVVRQMGKDSSVTYVPMNNEKSLSKLRHVLKKEEIDKILGSLPAEGMPWIENDRERQKSFKEILLYGDIRALIDLTRTLYLRQKEQKEKGKKLHIADEHFMKDAEKMIFEELAYVLDIPVDKVLEYIVQFSYN